VNTHRLGHAETAFKATAYEASLAPDALRTFEMNESDRGRHTDKGTLPYHGPWSGPIITRYKKVGQMRWTGRNCRT
jgi:hypothetical protein